MTASPRKQQIDAISNALGDRNLVFFGIRGHDAVSLLSIPQFRDCFAVTAPLHATSLENSATIEDLSRGRVDLDAYDIDMDTRPFVTDLRRQMLACLRHKNAVATYRPSHFLGAMSFASLESSDYLGVFKEIQSAFEHKPWVETQVARLGIRTIGWRYVADEHRDELRRELEQRPLVLRASRNSGGVGISLVEHPDDLDREWPRQVDHFVGVAQFLDPTIPINVGAVVYDEDNVVLHPASIQLIGIPELTNRRFGYCGNDFAAINEIPRRLLEEIEQSTLAIGRWLGRQTYRGAFGADYLIAGDDLYYAEINARLQGSTSLASRLAAEVDQPDILIDHVAAFLGIGPTHQPTLHDWAERLRPAAHLVCHNSTAEPLTRTAAPVTSHNTGADSQIQLLPAPGIATDPGGVLMRVVTGEQVTDDGFSITPRLANSLADLKGESHFVRSIP